MNKKFVNIARNLRKSSTEAEKHLWRYLRRKQLEGFKFRRQEPIGKYIVDFVNFERKIVSLTLSHRVERKKKKFDTTVARE